MCGRFTLRASSAELQKFFQLTHQPPWTPRYNIAPTQPVLGVRRTSAGREPGLLQWGLVPSWADDPSVGSRMINARAETLATRPAFRGPFRRRRCLVLADGFYEWKKQDGKDKQPYFVRRKDDRPFAFAGLWDHWTGADGSELESCVIVTTEPNELLKGIHDRMPVILAEWAYDEWLDPDNADVARLQRLLVPYPAELLEAFPVSKLVNNPRNDSPRCVEPLDAGPSGPPTLDFS